MRRAQHLTHFGAHTGPYSYLFAPMATFLHPHARAALEQLEKALVDVGRKPDHERVHALRTGLKKVRTLLRLSRSMAPGTRPPKGATQRILSLFKAAGAQREPEVSAKVLESFQGHMPARTAYNAHLKDRANKAKKGLRKAVAAVQRRDLERLMGYFTAVSSSMTRTQELRAADRFISQEMDAAGVKLIADATDDALHEVRKHLKNAWQTLQPLAKSGELSVAQKVLRKKLGTLQEALGDWHDLHVVWADLGTRGSTVQELKEAVDSMLQARRKQLLAELQVLLDR